MHIVSLVPSITELLADLDLDEELVGLTRFCILPEGWKSRKRIVGGTKNVNIERVEELKPDLVIANREENVREQVEAIARFAEVHLTDVSTVEEGIAMIREVGNLVGRGNAAEAMAGEIESGFAALDHTDTIPCAYLIWRRPYMAAGGDTFISDVMHQSGLRNVLADQQRYPEVDVDHLAASGARAVLLSSEPFPFEETHALELREAMPGMRVELVDGQLFSWYGSRMRLMPPYLKGLKRHLTSPR